MVSGSQVLHLKLNPEFSFPSRFGGTEFPPIILFKIYIHSGGQGVKYYSGKKVIKPASEVRSKQALERNGHVILRKYYTR